MHSHFHHSYSQIDSPIHRIPAAVKMILAVGLIVLLVTLPPTPVLFTLSGVALILVAGASNIPGGFIVRRLILLEPFVLGVAVLALLQPHGGMIFLILITRTTLCMLAIILLANTTRFSDMLVVLKAIHAPALIVTTLALLYRYLYVLKDQTLRMRRARTCRTFTRDRARTWQSLATVIAHLFLRSSERAERIYGAMCSRGWR